MLVTEIQFPVEHIELNVDDCRSKFVNKVDLATKGEGRSSFLPDANTLGSGIYRFFCPSA